jgi:hypothetical protein
MGSKPGERYPVFAAVLALTVKLCPSGLLVWETYQARNGAVLTKPFNACRVAELRRSKGKTIAESAYPSSGMPAFISSCFCPILRI